MKVLLLHEMSGVHTELRAGLRQIGVEADIATYGDGFKGYPTDINIGVARKDALSNIGRIVRQMLLASKSTSYDVIQFISPNSFHQVIAPLVNEFILRSHTKTIYIAAGSDAIYRKHVRELSYYPPHDWFDRPKEYRRLKSILGRVSRVVPVCWEYGYAMERAGIKATRPVVPFPIEIDKSRLKRLGDSRKIKILHPVNRPNMSFDFKGTLIINEAFKILESKYPNDVQCESVGGLGHKEYDELTDSVDVIVDQVYSYSYGMSAAYGLAKGKVVLSGLEEQAVRVGHYQYSPVINITPDVNSIVDAIGRLISSRNKLREIGARSVAFAEQYHDRDKVASVFASIYSNVNSV